MKGITPVVAIILLLLITIAVVGFAFGYFSTIMTTTGEAAGQQAEETTARLQKVVSIDNIYDDAVNADVTVRNVGSQAILVGEIAFYADDVPVTTLTWIGSPPSIAAGQTETATLTGMTGCISIRVVGPSNSDVKEC